MSDCKSCKHWVTARFRKYDDGTLVKTFMAPEGLGLCGALDTMTKPNFGCRAHERGNDHIVTDTIVGAPWQSWKMGDCPKCEGRGSHREGGVCDKCMGIGQVRHYDDGYIGEEKTRRHPKEKDAPAAIDPGTILAPQPKASVL